MLKLNKTYNESCLDTLGRISDNYLDCVVTSPPYWGLRDYGLEPSIWDAQDGCLHEWGSEFLGDTREIGAGHGGNSNRCLEKNRFVDGKPKPHIKISQGQFCTKCSAWHGNLGLEPTPELYVQHIVQIFNQIKRALKPEGTVWLNLGDSYWRNPAKGNQENGGHAGLHTGRTTAGAMQCKSCKLPEKNLLGIPWRVAFALQADGWYLRSDIIWHKPNPMPESVTDRPTKSHEYIFLLTKSAKYYYDINAIREKHIWADIDKRSELRRVETKDRNSKSAEKQYAIDGVGYHPAGRNKRSVWTVTTKPFKEAHFATYPPDLIRPCILAGCPVGGIVYDPFMGSGTTAEVAILNNRKYIGSELNPDYIKLSEKRLGIFK